MPLSTEVGLDPSYIVLDGDPAPLPPKRGESQFSAYICCGQTSGWIKVSLGTCHIALNGNPALPERAQQPPYFWPMVLWPQSPSSATGELLF